MAWAKKSPRVVWRELGFVKVSLRETYSQCRYVMDRTAVGSGYIKIQLDSLQLGCKESCHRNEPASGVLEHTKPLIESTQGQKEVRVWYPGGSLTEKPPRKGGTSKNPNRRQECQAIYRGG